MSSRTLDRTALVAAVRAFLAAVGQPLTGDFVWTPERVAEAWVSDFLNGYDISTREALGPLLPVEGDASDGGLVCVTGIDFHSICPHHLLPYRGLAHLAYLPTTGVVGFSSLGRLVDACAHRLILQEALAVRLARELARGTRARGAACVLEAEQSCLTCRGDHRRRARTHSEAFVGELAHDAELRTRFARAIAAGRPPWQREGAP